MEDDKIAKGDYLSDVPHVHSPSLKGHEKFKDYVDLLNTMH